MENFGRNFGDDVSTGIDECAGVHCASDFSQRDRAFLGVGTVCRVVRGSEVGEWPMGSHSAGGECDELHACWPDARDNLRLSAPGVEYGEHIAAYGDNRENTWEHKRRHCYYHHHKEQWRDATWFWRRQWA